MCRIPSLSIMSPVAWPHGNIGEDAASRSIKPFLFAPTFVNEDRCADVRLRERTRQVPRSGTESQPRPGPRLSLLYTRVAAS